MQIPDWAQPALFSAKVFNDLTGILTHVSAKDCDMTSKPFQRIIILTSRLQRIFDPDIGSTFAKTINGLLTGISLTDMSDLPPIQILDRLDTVENDSLYIVCIHLNEEDSVFVRVIRGCTNSMVVGWFWDNHHQYSDNAEIAKQVHICVPAHHHGSRMLEYVNPATTYPMPLGCSQWSAVRLYDFLGSSVSTPREYLLKARFSDWHVAPERKEIVDYYCRWGLGEDLKGKRILLSCTKPNEVEFFSFSPLEQFHDWLSTTTTLVLSVRNDVSSRFFDSLASGSIPIVDNSISKQALLDLLPSIANNADYITTDPTDPGALRHSLAEAQLLYLQENRRKSIQSLILNCHMFEHRIALLIFSILVSRS